MGGRSFVGVIFEDGLREDARCYPMPVFLQAEECRT